MSGGKGARDKGAKWEREVANFLKAGGVQAHRRIDNVHDRDDLVTDVSWASYECKNHKELKLAEWMDQAVSQSGPVRLPVVVHKRPRKPVEEAYVTMRLADHVTLVRGIDRLEALVKTLTSEVQTTGVSDDEPGPSPAANTGDTGDRSVGGSSQTEDAEAFGAHDSEPAPQPRPSQDGSGVARSWLLSGRPVDSTGAG